MTTTFPLRARWAMGLATAVVALAWAGPARAQDDDPARLLSEGRDAYEAGDFDRAREALWAYLDATARVSGPSRLPQAEALWYIALMEPDAGVAANHYRTILDEYAAASVADQALLRLAVYDLVSGDPGEARRRLERLRRDYPFSRTQPEIPMWIGRTHLVQRDETAAVEAFLEGYTKVKSQDLPTEIPGQQREALAAEYAYWLAAAYAQEGDLSTARQYYTLLTLDYPDSPQAADAREALASMGRGETPAGPDVSARVGGEQPAPVAGAVTPPPGEAEVDEAGRDPVADLEVVDRDEPEGRAEEPPGREVVETPVEREPVPVEREPAEVVEREPAAAEPEPAREARPRGPEARIDEPAKFPAPAAAGAVWLQVGAFTSASNAAELSKRLKADGFDTRVEVGIVDGQGYYRVRVGPFDRPADDARLEETRARLERLGYPARTVGREE